jgi:hypothetical protein
MEEDIIYLSDAVMDFQGFPKIARLSREVIVTEKIDGTNGQIFIGDNGEFLVGSRTRWITPECDNHGFARWAFDHINELTVGLGRGRHFGEWWGAGIQRGYGLPKGEKRFSLFNTIRWCCHDEEPARIEKHQQQLPSCCHLVPILYRGIFDTYIVDQVLEILADGGSWAAPDFMKPEGIVVYHVAGNVAFKKTLGDDGHKEGRKP